MKQGRAMLKGVLATIVFVGALLQGAASAQPVVPATPSIDSQIDAETVWDHYWTDSVVNGDGTAVYVTDERAHFRTDNAARAGSHVLLGYQPGYGSIELLEAWTIRKDGSRIAVPAGSIQTQIGRAARGAFSDSKTIQIEFPQVEAGGGIAYRYRQTDTHTRFNGQFIYWNGFDEGQLWHDVRISVDAPKGYPLAVKPREGTLVENTDADRHRIRWTYASPGERLDKPESVRLYSVNYQPGVLISSLRDYAQLAEIYRGMIYNHARPTAVAQKLADEITAGVDDPGEQAHRIFDWVRLNIRYVQLYLGDGGFVPHAVDAVLAAHFGDCKDHAVVLGALLAAKGIASTPVLIGADRDYTLPEPPYPYIFNHIITWVPMLARYLDSTSRYSSFSQLPGSDLGVPVVRIDDGTVDSTPSRSAAHDRTDSFTTLDVAEDGSATGTLRVLTQGADSISLRAQFETLGSGQKVDLVEKLLLAHGLIGDGEYQIETGLPPDQYAVLLNLTIRNFVNPADAGAVLLEPLLASAKNLVNVAASGQRYKARRHASGCAPAAIEEHYSLGFPAGFRVELPSSVTATEDGYRYQSDYRREAARVLVDRRYAATLERTICTPDDYQLQRRVSSTVLADLRKQIVYRRSATRQQP